MSYDNYLSGGSVLFSSLPVKGHVSRSFFVSRRISGSLEMGTHTSVLKPCYHGYKKGKNKTTNLFICMLCIPT